MACTEITNAFNWAKQSVHGLYFPVTAFFTRHTGNLTDPNVPTADPGLDYCWYAVGAVRLNAAGHLTGDLQLYTNSGVANPDGVMSLKTKLSLGVEIFPDGTVTYQHKLGGKPTGGMPPVQVTTTCLEGMLLTGINQNAVITVGVRREPSKQEIF